MKKIYKKIILAVFITMILMVGSISIISANKSFAKGTPQEMISFEKLIIETKSKKTHIFNVVIADTPEKSAKGLMFVRSMDENKGMLFEMGKEDIFRFWMKNTFIPLDIIFIAQDGEIKKIHENATPLSLKSMSSEVPVIGILEINGGLSKKLGISKGDKVKHAYFKK